MGCSVGRPPILGGSNLDGRRRAARRVKEVIRQFTAAVGGKPTPGQIVLIRIIGELTAITEAMRASMLGGGMVDSNFVQTHNTLLRTIEKLKLPSDIQTDEDLGSLMQRMAAAPKDDDEADDLDDQVDEPPAD